MQPEISAIIYNEKWGSSEPKFGKYLSSSEFLPMSMHEVMRLTGHRGCINTCSFNPYGELELTGCDDGCVWLWDVGRRNPKPKIMLRPHHTNVFTTNFLSENKFMSGANDADVRVTEVLNDGRVMSTCYYNHHIRKVLCSFVIDENTFATCSYDQTIRLFDIRTQYINQVTTELPVLSEDDMNYDGTERLTQDLARYQLRPQGEGGGSTQQLHLPIDQSSLLLDLSNEDCEIYAMDVHPFDRKRFIACTGAGTIRMFDMRSLRSGTVGRSGFAVNPHYRDCMTVTGVAYDASGERIAASVLGGSIHILDSNLFQDLETIPEVVPRPTNPLMRAILGFDDVDEVSFEEEEQESVAIAGEIMELNAHRSRQTSKAVNWFGDFVVTGSDNGSIYFYDTKNGGSVNILQGHEGCVNVVAVNRPKNLLATSGIDYYSILWGPQSIGSVNRDVIAERVERITGTEEQEVVICNVQ